MLSLVISKQGDQRRSSSPLFSANYEPMPPAFVWPGALYVLTPNPVSRPTTETPSLGYDPRTSLTTDPSLYTMRADSMGLLPLGWYWAKRREWAFPLSGASPVQGPRPTATWQTRTSTSTSTSTTPTSRFDCWACLLQVPASPLAIGTAPRQNEFEKRMPGW